jgi:hypothetical protein
MRSPNGNELNRQHHIDAKQGRYRETGDWYCPLRKFPATLWDTTGYLRFETEAELLDCARHGVAVHPSGQITAPKEGGIATIPGYVRIAAAPSIDDIEL